MVPSLILSTLLVLVAGKYRAIGDPGILANIS